MSKHETYSVDCDTGIEHRDSGPWRSYHLTAEGSTLEELLESAHIWEIDQDGGSLSDYPLDNCGTSMYDTCIDILRKEIT
jgi:hypothetical protein